MKYIAGSLKELKGQYGKFISCSLKLSDLQAIVNEKGYCNFTISPRTEEGKYGDTHYAKVSDYKPKEKKEEELPEFASEIPF